MIHIGRKGQLLVIFGDHVADQALTVEHQLAVELVFRAERPGFCEHVTCGGRIHLNFHKCAVFTQHRKSLEKDFVVGPRGPIRQVMHHKVRAEEICPVAASAVALAAARKVELRGLQKVVFNMESCVEGILRVFCHQRAEKIRPHSRMQILAHLQRHFDFFGEWRRDVLGDLVLRSIETRKQNKVSRRSTRRGLDLDACAHERFAENRFSKLRW